MANKWYIPKATEQLKDLSFPELERFSKILKSEIEDAAPGSLKDGVKVRVNRIRQQVTVASTHKSGLPVPVWVEFGTAPHVITPKTAEVLHWVDDGQDRFAKRVYHPGTAPNPYMRNATIRAVFKFKGA